MSSHHSNRPTDPQQNSVFLGTGMVFGDATNLCLIALLLVLAVASFIGSTTVAIPTGQTGNAPHEQEGDLLRLEIRADGQVRIIDTDIAFLPIDKLISSLAGNQVQIIGDEALPYSVLISHLSLLSQHETRVSLIYQQEPKQ